MSEGVINLMALTNEILSHKILFGPEPNLYLKEFVKKMLKSKNLM